MNFNTLKIRTAEVMLSERLEYLSEETRGLSQHETRELCLEVVSVVMEEYLVIYRSLVEQKEIYDELLFKRWGL